VKFEWALEQLLHDCFIAQIELVYLFLWDREVKICEWDRPFWDFNFELGLKELVPLDLSEHFQLNFFELLRISLVEKEWDLLVLDFNKVADELRVVLLRQFFLQFDLILLVERDEQVFRLVISNLWEETNDLGVKILSLEFHSQKEFRFVDLCELDIFEDLWSSVEEQALSLRHGDLWVSVPFDLLNTLQVLVEKLALLDELRKGRLFLR